MKTFLLPLICITIALNATAQTRTVYYQGFESASSSNFDSYHYQASNKPGVNNPIFGQLAPTSLSPCKNSGYHYGPANGNGWYYCNADEPEIFSAPLDYLQPGDPTPPNGTIYTGTVSLQYSSMIKDGVGGVPPTMGIKFYIIVLDEYGNEIAASRFISKDACDGSWSTTTLNFNSTTSKITVQIFDQNGGYDGNEIRLDDIQVVMNQSTPLPVDLLSFNAKADQCNAIVSWETANEAAFKGYELETSTNGVSFTKLAFIPGSNKGKYIYKVDQLSAQTFFRLKMVDQDGNFKYSHIVNIANNCNLGNEANIYLSPVTHNATIRFNAAVAQQAQIAVYDMAGRRLLNQSWKLNEGKNEKTVDMSSLSRGMYIVHIIEQNKAPKAIRIVKQ